MAQNNSNEKQLRTHEYVGIIDRTIKKPETDVIFNNSEAADFLGITPRTLEVWRCTKRYKIPFIKVGRLVKYRRSALEAFLESRTVGAEG